MTFLFSGLSFFFRLLFSCQFAFIGSVLVRFLLLRYSAVFVWLYVAWLLLCVCYTYPHLPLRSLFSYCTFTVIKHYYIFSPTVDNAENMEETFPKMGNKWGTTIGDDVIRKPMEAHNIRKDLSLRWLWNIV